MPRGRGPSFGAASIGDAAAAGPLTPAHLVQLLTSAVAALDRLGQLAVAAGGSRNDDARGAALERASHEVEAAVGRVVGACQVGDVAAANSAGRVPLPSSSPEVEAALGVLARLVDAGSAPCDAGAACPVHYVAAAALRVVSAVAFSAPKRAMVIAGHRGLVRALAAALGVRGDDRLLSAAMDAAEALLFEAVVGAAPAALWRADSSGAGLAALAAAFASGFAALQLSGGAAAQPLFEAQTCSVLTAAVVRCPETERPGLCNAVLTQPGLGDALSACVAHAAAAVPGPSETGCGEVPGGRVLVAVAALCSNGAVSMHVDGAHIAFGTKLELLPPNPDDHPLMERLLSSAPALLGRVVDVVAAAAPWCRAVAAALGPAGGGSGGGAAGAAGGAALAYNFAKIALNVWVWALAVLELMPVRALVAGRGGRAIARLTPLLLGLAEAGQAVAFAPPSASLTTEMRFGTAMTAIMAARILDGAVFALRGAAPALPDSAPGALAALVRLGTSEPPLPAFGGRRVLGLACRFFEAHCRLRVHATGALSNLARTPAGAERAAALLLDSPALLAAAGAAVGATDVERRFSRGDGMVAALVAGRRKITLSFLANALVGSPPGSICVNVTLLRSLMT